MVAETRFLLYCSTAAGARLLILPGGHGDYLGEAVMTPKDSGYPELTARLIEEFLNST